MFALRAARNAAAGVGLSGDLGLLHAVDDRLAAYGFETNTGARFVAVVDMRGRRAAGVPLAAGKGAAAGGGGGAVGPARGRVEAREFSFYFIFISGFFPLPLPLQGLGSLCCRVLDLSGRSGGHGGLDTY